jgi:hypothetical protein
MLVSEEVALAMGERASATSRSPPSAPLPPAGPHRVRCRPARLHLLRSPTPSVC